MLPTKFLTSSAAAYILHYYYYFCKTFEQLLLLLLLLLSAIRNFPADLSLYVVVYNDTCKNLHG
jgi:hypothetical protein